MDLRDGEQTLTPPSKAEFYLTHERIALMLAVLSYGNLRQPSSVPFELLGVMQLFSQGLREQTDQCVRNGIRS